MSRTSSGRAAARNVFLQVDAEAFGHPVQRPPIDAEHFGRTCAIAPDLFDHVKEITAFDLVK